VLVSFLVLAAVVIGVKSRWTPGGWACSSAAPVFVVCLHHAGHACGIEFCSACLKVTLSDGALDAAVGWRRSMARQAHFSTAWLATVLATPCPRRF